MTSSPTALRSEARPCGVEGCGHGALVHSDPPRCAHHIEDPDCWYDTFLEKEVDGESNLLRRRTLSLMGARFYQDALRCAPVFEFLSDEFTARNRSGSILEPPACFAITAVALGLDANCTYVPLSIHVRRFAAPTSPQAIEVFDEIAPRERYEQLRFERYGLSLGKLSCPGDLLAALYSRARLILNPSRVPPSLQEIDALVVGRRPD